MMKLGTYIWRGVLIPAALTISACGRCVTLDGMPLDATYSFDLLRPGQGPVAQAALPNGIRVFSEQNAHWDMDAACRTGSLTHLGDIEDPARIKEFVEAIRRDVTERDAAALSADCRDDTDLYHAFLRRPNGVGYLLVRRCSAANGTIHGRMTAYNPDGDVSMQAATETLHLIFNLSK